MVEISSQYSFGADKAVQISQAVFFYKGTQPELRHKNCKITLLMLFCSKCSFFHNISKSIQNLT